MAEVTLSTPAFYAKGSSGKSAVVGYESNQNRIARHTLVVPSTGASHIEFSFKGGTSGKGTVPNTLYFYIGTDPASHGSAGSGSEYTGKLTRTSGTYNYTGAADIILMPNTTYYVWVFPTNKVFGWIYWSRASGKAKATLTGGAMSALNARSGILGESQTLEVTKYQESFVHTIRYAIGNAVGVICDKIADTTISWTPPFDLAYQMPNADRGSLVLTIETYNGDVLIGSQKTETELLIPDSIVPAASATWEDTSAAYEIFGSFVQRVSRLVVEVTGVGSYGSSILNATVMLDGKPYSGGAISAVGNVVLQVGVTDSRGRSGYSEYKITVEQYDPPKVNVAVHRCQEDGTADDMGEYAQVRISGSVSNVKGINDATLTFKYGTETVTEGYEAGAFEYSSIIPAPSASTLTLSALLADKLRTAPPVTKVLSVGYATMDFLAGGKGIAFGTTAQKEGFVCAMNTDFCGKTVTGLPKPAEDTAPVTKESLLDLVYPVGSIYMSVNATNPSVLFGGTWERIQDRFLLAAGSTYAAGASGGSDKHYHSLSDAAVALINHHDGKFWFYEIEGVSFVASGSGAATGANVNAQQSAGIPLRGGTDTASTMPPYLSVYIWKRTA